MRSGGFDASRATGRWTVWLSGVAVAWGVFAWLVGPAVIRSAYSDGMFGFLGALMSGRGQHPVERYLGFWYDVAILGLVALVVVWLVGAVALRPATWRFLRSAWTRVPTFGGHVERRTVAVVVGLVMVTVAMHADASTDEWAETRGYEYESIAQGIATGHGFSFSPMDRWLYLDDEPAAGEYGSTAWKEPFYPYFLAGAFELFGERSGRIVVVLLQIGLLLGTCLLLYWLGRRLFGPPVGILAALVTISIPDLHQVVSATLQIHAISSLLLVTALLLLFRYAEEPSPRAALGVGLFLGLAALTHAVLVVLVPIAGVFVLLHGRAGEWRERMRPALGLVLVASLTILPWTARNYVTFGHLIPVQTGFGLFANVTTPYLVETYDDDVEACGDGSPPEFRAEDPADALHVLREDRNYTRTWQRGVRCVAERHAGAYRTLNEHERDGLHRAQFVEFVREHPLRFAELLATKAYFYLLDVPDHDRGSVPVAALGLIGLIYVAGRRRMWLFPAAILAYSVPFFLTAPLYYRYRAPLTPVLTLLAVVLVWRILERPARRIRAAWGDGPQ